MGILRNAINVMCLPGAMSEDLEEVTYDSMVLDNRVFNDHFRASVQYVQSLQAAFMDALDVIDGLARDLNQSENEMFIKEAMKNRTEYLEQVSKLAQLEAQNEKLLYLYQFYKGQATANQENISIKDEMAMEARGLVRNESGRFERQDSGSVTSDKKVLAFCYSEKGYTTEQIKDVLHLSKTATVGQYISQAKRYCKTYHSTITMDGNQEPHNYVMVQDDSQKHYSIDLEAIPDPVAVAI